MSQHKLTPLLRRFCYEYVKDRRLRDAAIRAGAPKRSAHVRANEWMRKPGVVQLIRTLIYEQESRLKISADMVINELARVAFFDASVLADVANGAVEPTELSADQRAAISEIQVSYNQEGRQIKVKTHSKLKALEILAQHFQLFEEPPDDKPEEYERPKSMKGES